MERLAAAPKGLGDGPRLPEQKNNRDGELYVEIKCRTVENHSKGCGYPTLPRGLARLVTTRRTLSLPTTTTCLDWSN